MATEKESVPKAILYYFPDSVWSTVPRLCLYEKGYSTDEYSLKVVDITKGENFSPSYLKINMNGTIPTLVVPTYETTGNDVATRFRSLRDTVTICDFLDQARNSQSSRTVSDKPAPTLSPATIEGKAVSDQLIALVHEPTVDPNFLQLACRDATELKTKQSLSGVLLDNRREAILRHITEAKNQAADAGAGIGNDQKLTFEQKMVAFLQEKEKANSLLWEIYHGKADEERQKAFFEASEKAWTKGVSTVLAKLEDMIKGPYALGDQVSLADLHVIAWLARVVKLAGGDGTPSGIEKLATTSVSQIGPRIKAFWNAWIERESFKQAYSKQLH